MATMIITGPLDMLKTIYETVNDAELKIEVLLEAGFLKYLGVARDIVGIAQQPAEAAEATQELPTEWVAQVTPKKPSMRGKVRGLNLPEGAPPLHEIFEEWVSQKQLGDIFNKKEFEPIMAEHGFAPSGSSGFFSKYMSRPNAKVAPFGRRTGDVTVIRSTLKTVKLDAKKVKFDAKKDMTMRDVLAWFIRDMPLGAVFHKSTLEPVMDAHGFSGGGTSAFLSNHIDKPTSLVERTGKRGEYRVIRKELKVEDDAKQVGGW